jgi:citrate lyase subunit beta/citryl-CoA lyase
MHFSFDPPVATVRRVEGPACDEFHHQDMHSMTTKNPPDRSLMRSLLFAPANNARHVAKLDAWGADCAILDLEDAVASSEKANARAAAARAIALPHVTPIYVRINGMQTDHALADLDAVTVAGLRGIVLPMTDGPEHIATADWALTQLERQRGLPEGAIALLPIVETARGLDAVEAIASKRGRVARIAFGAGDFVNDMAMEWTPDEGELLFARSRIAIASRAAGLAAPIDTAHVNIADARGLERATRHVRTLGFGGKFCIYPTQVAVVNAVFMPTEEEVARARGIVDAFERAEDRGQAAIRVDGAFVDYPIVFRASQVLEKHRLATQHAGAPAGSPHSAIPAGARADD